MPSSLYQSISRAQKQGWGEEGAQDLIIVLNQDLHPSTLWSWFCSLEKQNKSAPFYLAALKIFENVHHRSLFLYLKSVEIV